MTPRARTGAAAGAVVLALSVAGCGGGDASSPSTAATGATSPGGTTSPTTTTSTTTTATSADTVQASTSGSSSGTGTSTTPALADGPLLSWKGVSMRLPHGWTLQTPGTFVRGADAPGSPMSFYISSTEAFGKSDLDAKAADLLQHGHGLTRQPDLTVAGHTGFVLASGGRGLTYEWEFYTYDDDKLVGVQFNGYRSVLQTYLKTVIPTLDFG